MASLCIAYINVGSTCIIVFVLEFVMYGTMFFGMHRYGTEREKCLAETDKRVKLISDVCNGIRTVKYYCWEKPFKALVGEERRMKGRSTAAARASWCSFARSRTSSRGISTP